MAENERKPKNIKLGFFVILLNKLRIFKRTILALFSYKREIFLSYLYRSKARKRGLKAVQFDKFGRKLGWSILKNGDVNIGINYIVNPVNIVRYFEFDFCYNSQDWSKTKKVLDVSSPRLFSFYVINKYPEIEYNYINPDVKDTDETKKCLVSLNNPKNFQIDNVDATKLHYSNEQFNTVISISVIEHIPNDGDIKAIREMWRVIKKGGSFILTIPFARNFFEEYFDFDEYGLYLPTKAGKYFASRYYNEKAINERIYKTIGKRPDKIAIFGEIDKDTFFNYRSKQWKHGLKESIKDPYFVVTDYKSYSNLKDVVGLAVVGLFFKKK